jgi:DNA-binding CsgD family transcriptional regulator
MNLGDVQLALLEDLLAAPGNEAGWSAFLLHLCDALGGSTASFISHDFSSADTQIAINARTDPDAVAAYSAHWHSCDPWATSAVVQRVRPGSVAHGDELIAPEALRRTEFFADFGRRYGILSLAGFIEVSPRSLSCISIVAPAQRSRFGTEEAAFLRSMLPYVRRAIELHRRLSGAELLTIHSAAVLDRLPHGVLLLSARGAILSTNRTADEMLLARDGLISDRGELRGATPDATRTLQSALAAALALDDSRGGDTIGISLPRRSGHRSLSVIVAPLPNVRRVWVVDDARIVMFVTDPDRTRIASPATIARMLNLTPSEGRLAHELASGVSLEEAASRLSVRLETVRSRLKDIFRKTDTHRQADLVRLILSTPNLSAGG